ncbi:MAG: hypothetical protein K5694_02515 [Bacilli bacterium]|nr:hypothetical protein [Bacilli bacterium]
MEEESNDKILESIEKLTEERIEKHKEEYAIEKRHFILFLVFAIVIIPIGLFCFTISGTWEWLDLRVAGVITGIVLLVTSVILFIKAYHARKTMDILAEAIEKLGKG